MRSKPIVTSCDSRSREKDTMSPERLRTSFCSVSRALDPCCLMWTWSPWSLRKFWRLSSWRLAWRTMLGTFCSKWVICEVTGLARSTPIPAMTPNPAK